MAGKQTVMLLAIVVIAAIFRSCSAVTHIVGGSTGWVVPTSSSFYSDWASRQTFVVGDELVFNFPASAHTVAQVNRADHDSCNLNANTIGPVMTTAPSNITLNTAGTHYFICTIPTHCTNGQALAVTVTGSSAGSPASSPTPSAGGPSTPAAGSPSTPAAGSPTTPSGTTIPTASTPTAADGPGGSTPAGNSAASTGVSLLSLVSVAVAAMMF